jgi:hypothetical protein
MAVRSRIRVYFKPRDVNGVLTDWVEVSEDIDFNSLGKVSLLIDNDEYNVGLFNYNDLSLNLRNDHGKYSDITELSSIFRYKRGGSPVKITWQVQEDLPVCGIAICGEAILGAEENILTGVLNDEATNLNAGNQQVNFKILTKESIFSSLETPHASISALDTYSDTIFLVLNQAGVTETLTVDAGNITVGLDLAMDVVTEFENTTVKEALDVLLFQSNSVLFIENDIVYVESRDGGTVSEKTFYGQGSNNGLEDILDLSGITTGLKNVFNFWTWADTALVSTDVSSITANGIRKKEIEFKEITDTGKRNSVLDAQKTEFSSKKQELNLTTPMTYENLGVGLLDRVNVDYPPVYYLTDPDGEFPLYGSAIYGTAVYPLTDVSINILPTTNYKVMGKTVQFKKQTITFKLKEQ